MLLAVFFPRISIAIWQLISNTKKLYTSDADNPEADILDTDTSGKDTSGTDRDEKESDD